MHMFMFIFLAVLLLVVYALMKFRILWGKTKAPIYVYWVVQALLFANLIFCMMGNYGKIKIHALAEVMLLAATVEFVVLAYSAVLFLLCDLCALVFRLSGHAENKAVAFIKDWRGAAVIFSLTFLLAVAGYIKMGDIKETEYSVRIDKQSQNESFEIVMLSDAHIGTGVDREGIDEIVTRINNMEADAVLMVGDFFDHNTSEENRRYMSESFSNIKSKYGVYFAYGNHEKYIGEDLNEYFENAGITVLEDEAVTLAGDITILGRRDLSDNPEDIAEVLNKEKIDSDNPLIVLNHQPIGLEDIANDGTDLVLCGHTHGEQFPFTEYFAGLANDLVYGEKRYGNMTAITSSGIGGWGVHFKLPAKSELVKITLSFANSA